MNGKKEKNSIRAEDGSAETLEGTNQAENSGKDALNFIRIVDPNIFQLIPRYLFEQIKDLDSDAIDRIYEYGSSILTQVIPDEQGQLIRVANPLVWIAVLVDENHKIQGFLWAEFDPIELNIFVQAFSVEEQYQTKNGELLEQVKNYLLNLPIYDKFKQKISWATTRPQEFERRGFKRSQKILMEFESNNDTFDKQE